MERRRFRWCWFFLSGDINKDSQELAMPNNMPQAVLFDLDGTLIDSYDAITASVNEVRRIRNLHPLSVEEVRPKVGRGVESLLRSTVAETDLAVDIPRYKEHHAVACVGQTRLLPHAKELLGFLRDSGVRTGICSNKPRAFTKLILDALEIASLFDVVCGPEDASRPKPDPSMIVVAANRLGISVDEALYVGDMVVDITAGRAAGCVTWIVGTGSDSLETLISARPEAVFPDLQEMLSRLRVHGLADPSGASKACLG